MKCTQKQWAHTNHWGSYKLTLRHVRKNNGLIQIIGAHTNRLLERIENYLLIF